MKRPSARGGRAALVTAVAATAVLASARAQETAPPDRWAPIARAVDEAIARHELPGAVIVVGRGDRVLYHHAFGHRAVQPAPEPMTEDTIFDLASLTKVIATTPAVMQLVEQGRIRLDDPVARFIPEFGVDGKDRITILDLLTHTSGLPPDLPLEVEFSGADEAIRRASALRLDAPPGSRFVYSDINFFLLGDIVRRVSGETLDRYARARIFEPLGMHDTMFLPPASLRARIAPTQRCRPLAWPCNQPDAPFLRGVVHDPTARRMGGFAGHAGLFSTAADLSRYCRMLLAGGTLDGVRILAPAAVARMTRPSTPRGMRDVRGLGWDIDSSFAANRGELFPVGSTYGHTGFTGTGLWLDPATRSYVIFLSNRVHPDGTGDVTPLRARVSTIAASAIYTQQDVERARRLRGDGRQTEARPEAGGVSRAAPSPPTLAGIDVLAAQNFAPLAGKRVGLLTNQTGRLRSGASTIDALAEARGVRLVALFSPEHGIRGDRDEKIESSRDAKTGLPIYSLYGDTRKPTAAMLDGLDALVVDLQDAGARFYTYPAAVAYVMEAAAARKLPVVVLDRPNPIDGIDVEGPMQAPGGSRYVGYLPMPIRHGLTIGELARLFNVEAGIGADLTVVPMQHWLRTEWFDETGLEWVNPSPNLRTMTAATLYPGLGAIEQTNVSVGRGTDTPFEQVGAPWIDGVALAAALDARGIAGVRFYPVSFTPQTGAKLGGERCHGVFLIVTDRRAVRPVRVGLEIAAALSRLYGATFELEKALTLFGSAETLKRIRAGDDPSAIAASWKPEEDAWRRVAKKYELY
ncbi:MAG: serine hydrolase [Betaproteobacteria bacterium]